LLRVLVKRGDAVSAGDIVAEVETDKASHTVEADHPGFVLAVLPQVDDMIAVGSVLLWLGATPDDSVPESNPAEHPVLNPLPTVKAAQLLERYGLQAAEVQASDERVSARDVEEYVKVRGLKPIEADRQPSKEPGAVRRAPGTPHPLTPEERGMLRTVLWQRQEAVPGYVELKYDAAAWDRLAADYQKRERLLLNPLLALMAYRLTRIAKENPRLTSTILDDQRLEYDVVNLGFTVQSETTLYLVVVENAAALTCAEFIARLTDLQRRALARQLRVHEASGATIAFSSMARWNATCHIPVLPPQTALIIAHAASSADGRGTLGATYDHRVLTGFEAFSAVSAVSRLEGLQ
jgi:pyruvate/2-oxoglutarate dehydrogenase complex dihydrolipoamide acyltransferase (E2) component